MVGVGRKRQTNPWISLWRGCMLCLVFRNDILLERKKSWENLSLRARSIFSVERYLVVVLFGKKQRCQPAWSWRLATSLRIASLITNVPCRSNMLAEFSGGHLPQFNNGVLVRTHFTVLPRMLMSVRVKLKTHSMEVSGLVRHKYVHFLLPWFLCVLFFK